MVGYSKIKFENNDHEGDAAVTSLKKVDMVCFYCKLKENIVIWLECLHWILVNKNKVNL